VVWPSFRGCRLGRIWIVLWLALLLCVDGAAQAVDYARQVQPILHGAALSAMEKTLHKEG
jgi:hypothetical protein